MKMLFAFLSLPILASLAVAQSSIRAIKSPKEVVSEFMKLELEGARLTPEGRHETDNFLVLASTVSPYPINIVSDKFDANEIPSPQNKARVNIYSPYLYGQLDSDLRFKASIHMQAGNGLVREGTNSEYVLTLVDRRSAPASQVSRTKEPIGGSEWRIENAPSFGTISLTTAIRYVTEMRDKTTNATIKKNADETLGKLTKLH